MSYSQTAKIGGTSFTATVDAETNLASPVRVMAGEYSVTFDGNNFESKHLRRIRRGSVSLLKDDTAGPGKLTEYITEAREKSVDRWEGKASSTNSRVYLDLGEYCQFGCQVIEVIKDGTVPWTPYGAQNILQKHATITLNKCLAYSHSGVGFAKTSDDGRVQGGVGIVLDVTIQQIGGSARTVAVCHYAGGEVKGKFKGDYGDKKDLTKRAGIAKSIVN